MVGEGPSTQTGWVLRSSLVLRMTLYIKLRRGRPDALLVETHSLPFA